MRTAEPDSGPSAQVDRRAVQVVFGQQRRIGAMDIHSIRGGPLRASSSAARANGQRAIIKRKRAARSRGRAPGAVPENRDPSGDVPCAAFAMGRLNSTDAARVNPVS